MYQFISLCTLPWLVSVKSVLRNKSHDLSQCSLPGCCWTRTQPRDCPPELKGVSMWRYTLSTSVNDLCMCRMCWRELCNATARDRQQSNSNSTIHSKMTQWPDWPKMTQHKLIKYTPAWNVLEESQICDITECNKVSSESTNLVESAFNFHRMHLQVQDIPKCSVQWRVSWQLTYLSNSENQPAPSP